MPFHTEQLRLSGMSEEEIRDAAAAAQVSSGYSVFMHGVDTDLDEFRTELASMVEHIKAHAGSG